MFDGNFTNTYYNAEQRITLFRPGNRGFYSEKRVEIWCFLVGTGPQNVLKLVRKGEISPESLQQEADWIIISKKISEIIRP